MTHRFLAFDIEIAALIPEGETDWKAHRPLGITCAALAWTGESTPFAQVYYGDKGRSIFDPAPRMSRQECQYLVADLERATKDGYTILTWNGCSFDFDVLAEESGIHAECRELAMNHVDMMLQVHCLKGFPLGLDAVSKGLGLAGKTEGMNGALAPQMWADGEYSKVLEYVQQDVRSTLEVALAVEKRCGLSWISKSGRANHLAIPKWLTVAEALQLPEPNTSWMSDPMPRSRFTEWMAL